MRELIDRLLGRVPEHSPDESDFEPRHLAAAALMVEAALLDGEFSEAEHANIVHLLTTRFQMAPDVADALVTEAETAARDAVEWQSFTAAIKEGFGHEDRVNIIEMLWEVAYADGELHDYEASLLRRVAGLLYVSGRESGEARIRVRDRLGIKEN